MEVKAKDLKSGMQVILTVMSTYPSTEVPNRIIVSFAEDTFLAPLGIALRDSQEIEVIEPEEESKIPNLTKDLPFNIRFD